MILTDHHAELVFIVSNTGVIANTIQQYTIVVITFLHYLQCGFIQKSQTMM